MCQFPFLVVKFFPGDVPVQEYLHIQPKKMHLVSRGPLTCLGDTVILSKMRLQDLQEGETYDDLLKLLGPHGSKVREVIARIDASIKKTQEKYKHVSQVPRK